jgi:hypothetical protein
VFPLVFMFFTSGRVPDNAGQQKVGRASWQVLVN